MIKEYEYWKGQLLISIDGVEHFSSTKVHCNHCTTRAHRNGETSYHHSGLAAVVVHPDREEVFTLDFEPILNPDGSKKNNCERNAAKRLCQDLRERYPDLKPILVEDALLRQRAAHSANHRLWLALRVERQAGFAREPRSLNLLI